MRNLNLLFLLLAFYFFGPQIIAQNEPVEKGYQFKVIKSLPATPVKDQYRTGTCWSFATISFLESELLRMGKGEFDLSEMFVVRHCYPYKADKYVRMHGNTNFDAGGQALDVFWVLDHYGIVPEEVYDGLLTGEEKHVHGGMDAVLSGYLEKVKANNDEKLNLAWKDGLNGILDAFLGEYPEEFIYKGKVYTPETFAGELGLNTGDYVCIGSFTHHPFYQDFILEVPDNWMWHKIFNVPLHEMMRVLDYALEQGFTVIWDADVSERGFDRKTDIVLVPSENYEDLQGMDKLRWEGLNEKEMQNLLYDFSSPKKEKVITQAMRQKGFDDLKTTDDHLMHITGLAEDQDGNPFYIVKNSWGTEGRVFDGYFYVSKAYMEYKTIFFMVHKNAVPGTIRTKLGI